MPSTKPTARPAEEPTTANEAPHKPATKARTIVRRIILFSIAVGLIMGVAKYYRPRFNDQSKSWHQLGTWIDQYADTVLWMAGLVAITTAIGSLLWSVYRSRNTRGNEVVDTLAKHFGVHSENIRVRLKWRRRGLRSHRLLSGRIWLPRQFGTKYPPSETLPRALKDYLEDSISINVTFEPGRNLIKFGPEIQSDESRWWDGHPSLVKAATALEPLLKGLKIDQQRTTLDPQGTPTKITLSYEPTQHDINTAFRRKARSIIESKLASPTGRWMIHWNSIEHTAVIEPAPAMPTFIYNQGCDPRMLPDHVLPLGIKENGEPALWQPRRWPHLLISAATGGGKTVLLRTLVVMALICKWMVYIADAKMASFRPGFAHGWGLTNSHIATSGKTMEAVILAIYREMERRYTLMEAGVAEAKDFPPLVFIGDENSEVVPMMNAHAREEWLENHPEKNTVPKGIISPAVDALWGINRLGRQVGVYTVLAHQRVDVSYIPGEARDNMLSTWASGWLSAIGLKMLFGSYSVEQRITAPVGQTPGGEPLMEPVDGRGTANLGNGPEPVQAFFTPDPADTGLSPEERQVVEHLRARAEQAQREAAHPLLEGVMTYTPPSEKEIRDALSRNQPPPSPTAFEAASVSTKADTTSAERSPYVEQETGSDTSDMQRRVNPDDPTRGGELVPVIALSTGETILVDIQGEQVPAIIDDIVESPDDETSALIDYSIAAPDHPEYQQPGQVELDDSDEVWRI